MPYINEAIFTLYEGIGTKESIDAGIKLGLNCNLLIIMNNIDFFYSTYGTIDFG